MFLWEKSSSVAIQIKATVQLFILVSMIFCNFQWRDLYNLVKTAWWMIFSFLSRSPQWCQQDCHCGVSGGYGSVSGGSYRSIPLLQTEAVNRPSAKTGGSDRYPGWHATISYKALDALLRHLSLSGFLHNNLYIWIGYFHNVIILLQPFKSFLKQIWYPSVELPNLLICTRRQNLVTNKSQEVVDK